MGSSERSVQRRNTNTCASFTTTWASFHWNGNELGMHRQYFRISPAVGSASIQPVKRTLGIIFSRSHAFFCDLDYESMLRTSVSGRAHEPELDTRLTTRYPCSRHNACFYSAAGDSRETTVTSHPLSAGDAATNAKEAGTATASPTNAAAGAPNPET